MTPAQRLINWIEELVSLWGERLAGWFGNWAARSIYRAFEDMEPGAIEGAKDLLIAYRDSPGVTDVQRKAIDAAMTPGNPISTVAAMLIFPIQALCTLLGGSEPMGNLLRYSQDLALRTARFDPQTVITAWRRYGEVYNYLFEDLKEQGWTDDRIETMKRIMVAYPTLRDVIGFYAHEVFEPDMVEKYGLRSELPPYGGTLFEKLGVPMDIATNYWIDHWEHPSWMQIVEMLHRGLVNEDDVYEWMRLVEIPPYWRALMIQSAYTWPTRVDVRRFYDLQTIDDARLREIYSGMGYRGKNLEDYILWTKIYVRLPDLLARWKNGWITLDQVRSSLVGYGMTATAAQEVIETKVKAVEPAGTAEGKELTKSEIYKGVKQGVLSFDEGIDLLMDLDYTYDQAEYLLSTNVAVLAGSPESYTEYKDLTTKYRKTVGLETKAMPEELKAAAAKVVELTNDLKALQDDLAKFNQGLIDVDPIPADILGERTAKEAAVADAERQLAYAKSTYDTELAKWRHSQETTS